MIKTKAFRIQSICLLCILCSIWVFFIIIGFFCDDSVISNTFVITGFSLLLICFILQLFIYKNKNLTISFDDKGIRIINTDFEINWENITGLYYQNLWFICLPCELEIFVIDDKVVKNIGELYGVNVYISKRNYKKILKLIPKEWLNKNEFLIYENIET